jgi:hypothetical protein
LEKATYFGGIYHTYIYNERVIAAGFFNGLFFDHGDGGKCFSEMPGLS